MDISMIYVYISMFDKSISACFLSWYYQVELNKPYLSSQIALKASLPSPTEFPTARLLPSHNHSQLL